MQNLDYNVGFFAKTIVYYYLDNIDMPVVSIAGVHEELFELVSENDTISKFHFFPFGFYF